MFITVCTEGGAFAAENLALDKRASQSSEEPKYKDQGWSADKAKRIDYPIHDRVFSYQKQPVDRLFQAVTLQTIVLYDFLVYT